MKNPLVSVLVCVYNREKYLGECLESVLSSTFGDWELIIVDDGSNDDSLAVAREFEARDERIKLYVNKENLGQFENRNYSATLAKGKYLKYLDSDDTIYPHGLEVMVRTIQQFPDSGAAISSDKPDGNIPYPIKMSPVESFRASYLSGGFPHSGPSASIIDREAFSMIKGFPKPYYVGTDSVFWLKLASLYPIVKMQTDLCWYREHPGQAIQQGIKTYEYLRHHYLVFSNLLNDENCPLDNHDQKKAMEKLKKDYLHSLVNLAVKEKHPWLAYSFLKDSDLSLSDLLK